MMNMPRTPKLPVKIHDHKIHGGSIKMNPPLSEMPMQPYQNPIQPGTPGMDMDKNS